MSDVGQQILPAFALGAALGAAPGPVQLLILSETARGGLGRGLRVMAGANGTLFVVVAALALGFSAFRPGEGPLRALRIVGGGFLVFIAVNELRALRSGAVDEDGRTASGSSLGPTARGVISVIVNPGAWIFFATTASAVVAEATTDGGRDVALLAALAMTAGVSLTDLTFALIGTGGRALVGVRGLRWIRAALSFALLAIGAWFITDGLMST